MSEECDCGYCGKCREQYQHEVDTQDDSGYSRTKEDEEPKHYYWRL